jgi:NAD(P)-dependent dehydrogenase (short-subunit alcohol dehydrogenase family)
VSDEVRRKLLPGRVAIVTGASRGIGKAIALCLAEEGCRVAINYLNSTAAAREVGLQVERLNPEGSLLIRANVTRESEVAAMVEQTVRRFGRIDILVNNAGIAGSRTFLQISREEWTRMIETNLTSVYHCCRAVLPCMLERRWGRIINIASTSALTGGTSGAHYAAAKGGVITLTKSLSSEFASQGITVNSIVPSKIETDMLWASLDEEAKKALLARIPVHRFGRPEEIGRLAAFLASEQAGYITGEMIVASGGYR